MSKHVKTRDEYAGTRYGRVRKHSKINRYYSIQCDDGSFICYDWFLTLNGVRLAVILHDMGFTEGQLNYIDCDSIVNGIRYKKTNPNQSIKDLLMIEAEKISKRAKVSE